MPDPAVDPLWLQFAVAILLGQFALQVIREILNVKGRGENGQSYQATRKAVTDGTQPLSATLAEIRSDTEKLRASQHRSNEINQAAIGKLDLAHVKLDTVIRHVESK